MMGSRGKTRTDASHQGQDASDARKGGLCDSAEMVGQEGTEQESGEVSGFAHGRETAGRIPNMACGEPTAVLKPAAQLVFVPSRPSSRVSVSQHSVSGESESESFSNLVTLGCGVGFRSAPGSPTATYENHETKVGEPNGKPACEVAKLSKKPTPTELAGNSGKAQVRVTWRTPGSESIKTRARVVSEGT